VGAVARGTGYGVRGTGHGARGAGHGARQADREGTWGGEYEYEEEYEHEYEYEEEYEHEYEYEEEYEHEVGRDFQARRRWARGGKGRFSSCLVSARGGLACGRAHFRAVGTSLPWGDHWRRRGVFGGKMSSPPEAPEVPSRRAARSRDLCLKGGSGGGRVKAWKKH
jgi:hypothetical protein